MEKPGIVNYVELSNGVICIENLSREQHREISEMLQERMMTFAGYKRNPA